MELYQDILTLFKSQSLGFEALARKVFDYQSQNNKIYRQFLELINYDLDQSFQLDTVPLMPISFFKSYNIKSGDWKHEKLFLSSGTTSDFRSKHYCKLLSCINLFQGILFLMWE